MPQLSNSQLYELTRRYFGDLGEDVVQTMYNIALRESGGNTSAYNGVGRDNSHGLWQINVHPEANPDLAGMDLTNPEENARAARIVYNRQGPTAWSTYEGGASTVGSKTSPKGVIDAIIMGELQNPPRYREPGHEDEEIEEFDARRQTYTQGLNAYRALRDSYEDEESGILRLEDGSIITREQLDQLQPYERAQVETYLKNKNIDRDNAYNDLLNRYDLSEFNTRSGQIEAENSRLSQDFQNKLGAYREAFDLDKANQNTVIAQVERQLGGLSESRGRTSVALDALLKAAPWGTSNGKFEFSPEDFGALGVRAAELAGIPLGTPALRYTGVMNVDPNAMLNAYDQQLGVTGPLPEIPALTTTPGMIPQAPATAPVPQNVPVPRAPAPPVHDPLPPAPAAPQAVPSEPLDPITASIIDLMGLF